MIRITVCEPWCLDFEHVPFNTSLLRTIQLAFPSAVINFFGEERHTSRIERDLKARGLLERISFQQIDLPKRGLPAIRQFLGELLICWKVFSRAKSLRSECIVFTCIQGSSLLALKIGMFVFDISVPTLAIPHNSLTALAGRPSRRPWNRLIGLQSTIGYPSSPHLRLILLGDSIYKEAISLRPSLAEQCVSLDHPYLWASNELQETLCATFDGIVRFGFLGASSKGFESFCLLAKKIVRHQSDVEFVMAGFLSTPSNVQHPSEAVKGISAQPLEPDEYSRRISSLTYCVWLGDSQTYRLVASGTFLDALSFMKPCIALRNPYIEHYFELLGDIGYLCDSEEEIAELIEDLLRDKPNERYEIQARNIQASRGIFDPVNLAPKLREICLEATRISNSLPQQRRSGT